MATIRAEEARAAIKASLAFVEVAIMQNAVASNAIVAALASMLADDHDEAQEHVMKALSSLRDARETASKIGQYASKAFG